MEPTVVIGGDFIGRPPKYTFLEEIRELKMASFEADHVWRDGETVAQYVPFVILWRLTWNKQKEKLQALER